MRRERLWKQDKHLSARFRAPCHGFCSIAVAQENVAALQQQLADLEAQFKAESEALAEASDPLQEKLERVSLKPAKTNITVTLVTLAWTPHWRSSDGSMAPAWT